MSLQGVPVAVVRGLCVALCLAAAASADVHVVDASGGGDFTTLQAAVNAAADGDTLLVRAGSYAGFQLTGKGLSIVAERGAQPQIAAGVRILSVPAGRTVVLSGLHVEGPSTSDPLKFHALVANDVGAALRVQDCTLIGSICPGVGGSGAVLSNVTDAVLSRCTVTGNRGLKGYDCCSLGAQGGAGLQSSASIFALYDCQLTGGVGGYSGWGGHGGAGAWVPDFGLFAAGCTFEGGKGGLGDDFIFGPGGNGGAGLKVGGSAQAQLRGNTYIGGAGGASFLGQIGQPGLGLEAQPGSTVIQYPGSARRFELEPVGWEGSLMPLKVTGEPGDRVWFPSSPRSGFRFATPLSGVWALALPVKMLAAPQGIVPASGTLELFVPITDFPGEADLRHFQGYVISSSGQAYTGTPTSFVRLGCAFSPDCDASGTADACEIQSGAVSDCNHNGIPDGCDVDTGVLLDCNANGTADLCDIQGGSSVDCDLNGVPDECQYDCNGNGIADLCDVQAGTSQDCDGNLVPDECDADCNANGVPDACDIAGGTSFDSNGNGVPDECQSPSDVYLVDDDGPPYGADGTPAKPFDTLGKAFDYAIDGNTILVLDGTYVGPENRGLQFGSRDLVVASQHGAAAVLIDCGGLDRAFVIGPGTSLAARLEGLTIRNGNAADASSVPGRGGAVLVPSQGAATLVDCVIEQCAAPFGGGVFVAPDSDGWIEGCTVRHNTATLEANIDSGGGGISSSQTGTPSTGTLVLKDCLVEDNAGYRGAGLLLVSGLTRVESCTVQGNHKVINGGGGIVHKGTGSLEVVSSRIVANVGGGAAGIHSESRGSLLVSHCVIAGNQGSNVAFGGGISAVNNAPPALEVVVESCLITGNIASQGGGIFGSGLRSIVVRDCSIVQNSAPQAAAAELSQNANATLRNCVVWGNLSGFNSATFHANWTPVNVDSCDVQGGLAGTTVANGGSFLWGAHNLDADPLFVDADGPDGLPSTWADNDFRLGPFSPCADAGDNAAVGADLFDLDGDLDFLEPVPFDLDLLPRFQDDPAVPDTGLGTAPIVDIGAYERP